MTFGATTQLSRPAPSRVKCLLVDDLEENLLVLSALLASDEVEVLQARSGEQALELLLQHEVALALLDVQMPGMDGFELAELMRGSERTRHVPLIFVTAGAHDQHRIFKGYDSGAVDFLYKPIEPRILRNKAEVFFQLHRQKRQLAQQLQERTETLRLHEMFTAVLGHDLRNPLGAMLMAAHLLERHSSDAVVKDAAARMVSSGKRMGRMIDDLLDLARARLAGGIALQRTTVDLAALVRRVVQEHGAAGTAADVRIAHDGDACGEWDADRLSQVVSNLLGNALQHGDRTEAIDLDVDGRLPDAVLLSVVNTGHIPPEMLPHMFDPFRGGTQGGRDNGLGLGLYIVQQIVQAHGGRIGIEMVQQRRVRFQVRLPRRPQPPGTGGLAG